MFHPTRGELKPYFLLLIKKLQDRCLGSFVSVGPQWSLCQKAMPRKDRRFIGTCRSLEIQERTNERMNE